MTGRKKTYIVASVGVVIGAMLLARWARQPSVSMPTANVSQVKAATTEELVDYSNDYITLRIPKRFVAKQPTVGNGKPLYIQQLLTVPLQQSGGIYSDQLAITVGAVPPLGLEEVSDVHLRARSSDYTQLVTNNPAILAYTSTRQSTYEIGYFTSHNNLYVSIVLTTPLSDEQKASELASTMLQSLLWRQ